jgi:hypothetical protein
LVESRRKWIEARKITKKGIYPSFPLTINSPSFAKSQLKSLTMLFRLPISSTTSSLILSPLKQLEMYLKRTIFALLLRRNALYSKSNIK